MPSAWYRRTAEVIRESGPTFILSPTQLFVLSFLGLIAVGTLGLLVLPGLYTGERLGFVDALFTATSAVCVTGLIVVDTAKYFTPLGQAWIALLIQVGGLGILTFTTLVAMALGRRSTLHVEEAAGGQAKLLAYADPRGLLRSVVAVTFTVEAIGAVLLWLLWHGRLGARHAVWPAIFHAVSAFCNAGFSVFSTSLEGFQGSVGTLTTMAALIVLGGLGFVVLEDLRLRYITKTTQRLTLHTRLVLIVTLGLILAGMSGYLLFEWSHELRHLPWLDRLSNALFMSITPRTAGFNTVDYNHLSNASIFLTILLMLIGGSPNSTAGGLKTTTVALLGLLFIARLRGEPSVSLHGRSVPEETLQRSAGVVIGGTVLLAVTVFLLMIIEPGELAAVDRSFFLQLVFEAHSAFGTVGLSMGATPALSSAGRLAITVLMFAGRVGPLSLVAAMTLAGRRRRPEYRFSHEDVLIG